MHFLAAMIYSLRDSNASLFARRVCNFPSLAAERSFHQFYAICLHWIYGEDAVDAVGLRAHSVPRGDELYEVEHGFV